jgi:hypothetical protein
MRLDQVCFALVRCNSVNLLCIMIELPIGFRCLLDLIHGSDISGSRVRFVDPPVLTAFPAFVFLSVGRGFVHHRHVGHSVFQFYCDAGASAWFSFLPQQIPRAGCHPGSGFFGWFSRLGAALRFASSFGSCSVLVRRSIWAFHRLSCLGFDGVSRSTACPR